MQNVSVSTGITGALGPPASFEREPTLFTTSRPNAIWRCDSLDSLQSGPAKSEGGASSLSRLRERPLPPVDPVKKSTPPAAQPAFSLAALANPHLRASQRGGSTAPSLAASLRDGAGREIWETKSARGGDDDGKSEKSDSTLSVHADNVPQPWQGLGSLSGLAKCQLAGLRGESSNPPLTASPGDGDTPLLRPLSSRWDEDGQSEKTNSTLSVCPTAFKQQWSGLRSLAELHLTAQREGGAIDSAPPSMREVGPAYRALDGVSQAAPSVLQRLAAEHSRLLNKGRGEREQRKELVATISSTALEKDPMARPSCNALLRAYVMASPPQWQRAQVLVSCMLRCVLFLTILCKALAVGHVLLSRTFTQQVRAGTERKRHLSQGAPRC
jgi:hypothetical protein